MSTLASALQFSTKHSPANAKFGCILQLSMLTKEAGASMHANMCIILPLSHLVPSQKAKTMTGGLLEHCAFDLSRWSNKLVS
jgi:hypothetical protein